MTWTIVERADVELRSILFYDPAHDKGMPARRFVGRVPGLDDGGNEDEYADDRITLALPVIDACSDRVFTSSVINAHVALSFCDDGFHRPVLDIDRAWTEAELANFVDRLDLEFAGGPWFASRSTHGGVHLWGAGAMPWDEYRSMLREARGRGVDVDWVGHVLRRGFGSLRLPAVTKGWE